MTLSFTQTIDGLPNYFPHKIWRSILNEKLADDDFISFCYQPWFNKFGHTMPMMDGLVIPPKLHTIRFDPHKRWGAGRLIHPVINNRTPNRFQFAPTIPCKSVQRIDLMTFNHLPKNLCTEQAGFLENLIIKDCEFVNYWKLWVGDFETGRYLSKDEMEILAINDGFDNIQSFVDYFRNGITNGSLIHWTDKRY